MPVLTVDLIYFAGCPNIERTRENLKDAFARLGRAPSWLEWDAGDGATPAEFQGYGSPTVLVNGRDVAPLDQPTPSGVRACRIYGFDDFPGAPGVDLLARVIESAAGPVAATRAPRPAAGGRWRNLAFLPAVGLAAIPVGLCPACFAAYFAVFTALGLGVLLDPVVLAPVAVLALLPAIAALAWKAPTRHGYRPFWLGLVGAAGIATGQLILSQPSLVWAGVATLVAAAVWNAWPRSDRPYCAACVPAPAGQHIGTSESKRPSPDSR